MQQIAIVNSHQFQPGKCRHPPPIGVTKNPECFSVTSVDHLNCLAQDNMKDQAQLKYAVCQGVLVMLHPAGWIGECAATMLSYKGRHLARWQGATGANVRNA